MDYTDPFVWQSDNGLWNAAMCRYGQPHLVDRMWYDLASEDDAVAALPKDRESAWIRSVLDGSPDHEALEATKQEYMMESEGLFGSMRELDDLRVDRDD